MKGRGKMEIVWWLVVFPLLLSMLGMLLLTLGAIVVWLVCLVRAGIDHYRGIW